MANQSSSLLSEPALGCLQFAEVCLSAALSLCKSDKPGYIRKPPFLCSAFLLTSLRVALMNCTAEDAVDKKRKGVGKSRSTKRRSLQVKKPGITRVGLGRIEIYGAVLILVIDTDYHLWMTFQPH